MRPRLLVPGWLSERNGRRPHATSAGASICFFYLLFYFVAHRWNAAHFLQQIKGLDLRDLTRDQFDQFGVLTDRSFQVPRELQDMQVDAAKEW